MRPTPVLALMLALSMTGDGAVAQVPPARPVMGVAWPAPVGHFQPRARDIPLSVSSSPEQDARDRLLDEKLRICRGC